jgi:hypothetical protein
MQCFAAHDSDDSRWGLRTKTTRFQKFRMGIQRVHACAGLSTPNGSLRTNQPSGSSPMHPQLEQHAQQMWLQMPRPGWASPPNPGQTWGPPPPRGAERDVPPDFTAAFQGLSVNQGMSRGPFRPQHGTRGPLPPHAGGPILSPESPGLCRGSPPFGSQGYLGARMPMRSHQTSPVFPGPLRGGPPNQAFSQFRPRNGYTYGRGHGRGRLNGNHPMYQALSGGRHAQPVVGNHLTAQLLMQPWPAPDLDSLEGKLLALLPEASRAPTSPPTALAPLPLRQARTLNRLLAWTNSPPPTSSVAPAASTASSIPQGHLLHTSSHPEWCPATGEVVPSPQSGASGAGTLSLASTSSACNITAPHSEANPGKTTPASTLPLVCLLPWVRPIAALLRNGGLLITLSSVHDKLAWGDVPVPQLSCDCMPEAVKQLPVEGITRATMFRNRTHLPEGWRVRKEWDGDDSVVLAGELHGLLLICTFQDRSILPSLQSVLLLCAHVCLQFLLNRPTKRQFC